MQASSHEQDLLLTTYTQPIPMRSNHLAIGVFIMHPAMLFIKFMAFYLILLRNFNLRS